jgi:hypothetical protein
MKTNRKRDRPSHTQTHQTGTRNLRRIRRRCLARARDPRFTGKMALDAVLDRDEIELERLKKTFAQRMSEKEKDKIRFHIVCK